MPTVKEDKALLPGTANFRRHNHPEQLLTVQRLAAWAGEINKTVAPVAAMAMAVTAQTAAAATVPAVVATAAMARLALTRARQDE